MGTWGTSLYENDFTKDVREDYLKLILSGKSAEEASSEMISANSDILNGSDDEPLFWYALSDTQWDYGRLQPLVKEKALFFLSKEKVDQWNTLWTIRSKEWGEECARLREKLLSVPPPMKRIRKPKPFHCDWKLGSVFAYRFNTDYSKEKGVFHNYIVFRKVSEDVFYPDHIVPVINIYQWVGTEIPSLEIIRTMSLLPVYSAKAIERRRRIGINQYNLNITYSSKEEIPEKNLAFIGIIPGEDLVPFQGFDFWTGNNIAAWDTSESNRKFEKVVINLLVEWNVVATD